MHNTCDDDLLGAVLLTKIAHDLMFINPFSLHRLLLNTDTAVQWP
ncbi:hypothetical protein [Acinetobacter bohemicus]|nr:hypothetical protein [Acinetobacter bohemicus]